MLRITNYMDLTMQQMQLRQFVDEVLRKVRMPFSFFTSPPSKQVVGMSQFEDEKLISDEEMAKSDFGQSSNTAKALRR